MSQTRSRMAGRLPFESLPEWVAPEGLAFEERAVSSAPERERHRGVVRELGGLVRNVRIRFSAAPGRWYLHVAPGDKFGGDNVSAYGDGDGPVLAPTTPLFKLAYFQSSVTSSQPFALVYEYAPSSEAAPGGWARLPVETNVAAECVVGAGYEIAGFRVLK